MSKPIKRLEIIKNAIELEDDDIIASQLPHLKNETDDPVIDDIVLALEEKRYGEAVAAIMAWLQSQRAIVHWQDPRIAACKLELKALEEQLRDLIDKRNARIARLDEFNDLYMSRLGPLMTEVLRLRKVLAEASLRKREAEMNLDDDDIVARRARDEAREQYETYREQQQKAQNRRDRQENMSESDRHELKRLWRQASKLCHPDLVDDALKAEANDMMAQLNQARQRGDLTTIRSLLARLQHGHQPMLASDRLNDLSLLQRKVASIQQQIASLNTEMLKLAKEKSWLLVSTLTNPEAYFRQQEKALSNTIATLQKQILESGFDEVA
ncbi:DNA repair protein [Trabulsiella odontotermitis]|uniref:DNA repair protein n=1 Tax=Trabulsiella odontotermitis TaxID=379893 RepID=UPI0024B6A0C6|nr:DNA repair protein [Trabulsiella odontotermitis]WHP31934.1 DNA repair protein [Trabulsiella odontotermitis]